MADGSLPPLAEPLADVAADSATFRRATPGGAAKVAKRCFQIAGCIMGLGFLLAIPLGNPWAPLFGSLAASAVAFVGAVAGGVEIYRRYRMPEAGLSVSSMSFFTLAQAGFSVFGVFAAFVSALAFGRGRQLRRRGEILLPALENASTWTTETKQLDLTDDVTIAEDVRPALAAQWRENGRSEHASVAAFARLTLDLVALGAPPALIADAQRDALDEIRHAELCFSLAEGLDGRAVSPGAFREAQTARTLPSMRTPALATLAVDSLIDGALHEGVSAAVVAELARRTEVPTIRDMLVEIARDEGRHAAHGWDVALWCIDQGGELVLAAVRGALVGLPKTMNTNLPAEAKSGAWERYGIMGEELEREAYARMLVNLERRVARLGERTDWRMQA